MNYGLEVSGLTNEPNKKKRSENDPFLARKKPNKAAKILLERLLEHCCSGLKKLVLWTFEILELFAAEEKIKTNFMGAKTG